MTLRKPSLFFRAIILGAQGVYFNLFCEWYRVWISKSLLTDVDSSILHNLTTYLSPLCWIFGGRSRLDLVRSLLHFTPVEKCSPISVLDASRKWNQDVYLNGPTCLLQKLRKTTGV
jgi:hypothetical protein